MSICARCLEPEETATGEPASSLALCPEHTLAVLVDVRRHLATTLVSLERAADRLTRTVAPRSAMD
ncbi:MAG TPA: hypothetical protein VGT02_12480 [Methylomirabilota bacterium]|nr:hypothetical protein [Methylomirabilota bacterium]